MDIIGKAIKSLPTRTGVSQRTGEQWQLQEYLIETQEQYPKFVCFEVFGADKIKEFNIHKNDIIKVYFNVESREYKGNWYTHIRAWKIEHINQTQPAGTAKSSVPAKPNNTPVAMPTHSNDFDEDVPF